MDREQDKRASDGATAPSTRASATPGVGKQTLTMGLSSAHAAPVQRKRDSGDASPSRPAAPSSHGDQPLPTSTRTTMDALFGADFSAVRIHQDASAEVIGAQAYTQGHDIHFAPGQYDPHSRQGQELLGHELTHVVQQRQGRVQPDQRAAKGAPLNDDAALEAEADQMGQRAARGERVGMAAPPGEAAPHPSPPIQRRVWVHGQREGRRLASHGTLVMPNNATSEQLEALRKVSAGEIDAEAAWDNVKAELRKLASERPELVQGRENLETEVEAKLKEWIGLLSSHENLLKDDPGVPGERPGVRPDKNPEMVEYTEDRTYLGYEDLTIALIHESDRKVVARLEVEARLAGEVAADPAYIAEIDALLTALCSNLTEEDKERLALTISRYAQFSSLPKTLDLLGGPSGAEMAEKCILLDEISELMNPKNPKSLSLSEGFKENYKGLPDYDRINLYTLNEDHPWVREARAQGVPLQAGPSGTTSRICAMAKQAGFSAERIYKIAWCMFAFFNGMWRGWSGTHRLHECMVAAGMYVDVEAMGYKPDMTELKAS